MFPPSPRARLALRWGGGIAALLTLQTLLLAGIFWIVTTEGRLHDVEAGFQGDCREFGLMAKGERMEELRQALDRDIHRDRFLGLFDPDGSLLEGNVARLPAPASPTASRTATIRPTELPGKSHDQVRYATCAFPDGTQLLTAIDLDDTDYAARIVVRALLFGLMPALLLTVAAGAVAGSRAARQVDAVGALTRRIVAGDLRDRLPVAAGALDSFGLLCVEINTMLDRLEALVGDVRGIGDDIAHQMRTPLTRLRARMERAAATAPGTPTATLAGDALVELDKLLGMVAAVLRIRELSHHERRSRFADVDLHRLIADACDLYRPIAEEGGGAIACDIQPVRPVAGDPSLLMEAVANLIDNAVKFGPAGGTVAVRLREEGGTSVVTVSDQGSGIPPAERTVVTRRFHRGRHDREGVGLGLSLVTAIAELHGFLLRFEDGGSALSLVMPPARG